MRVEFTVVGEKKGKIDSSTFRSLSEAEEFFNKYYNWYTNKQGRITLYKTYWVGNSFHHYEVLNKGTANN